MVALLDSYCGLYMAQTSDRVATKYGVTRAEQDAYALSSQQRAAAAWAACRLSEEIVPVEVKAGRKTVRVEKDDHLRPDSTLEGLATLPPSFGEDGGGHGRQRVGHRGRRGRRGRDVRGARRRRRDASRSGAWSRGPSSASSRS